MDVRCVDSVTRERGDCSKGKRDVSARRSDLLKSGIDLGARFEATIKAGTAGQRQEEVTASTTYTEEGITKAR